MVVVATKTKSEEKGLAVQREEDGSAERGREGKKIDFVYLTSCLFHQVFFTKAWTRGTI